MKQPQAAFLILYTGSQCEPSILIKVKLESILQDEEEQAQAWTLNLL